MPVLASAVPTRVVPSCEGNDDVSFLQYRWCPMNPNSSVTTLLLTKTGEDPIRPVENVADSQEAYERNGRLRVNSLRSWRTDHGVG